MTIYMGERNCDLHRYWGMDFFCINAKNNIERVLAFDLHFQLAGFSRY